MRDANDRHERDVFIDALRVLAVTTVVIAHFATTTVVWEKGQIAAENALSALPGTHLATWALQVLPLLFFVGGFANARSLVLHGGDYAAYLRTRLVRLLTPTLVFIAVWLTVGIVAEPLPLPAPNVVERAADLAALPLWFLGLYVIVVALAPPMQRLHERLGWWVPALLLLGAGAVDVLVHGLGVGEVGVANYAFVWLMPHQVGILYADGKLDRACGRIAGAIATGGVLGLVLAVTVAGYPVSMVGVPGEERWNTDPPSLALVALTLWLLGLALLARPWIQRAARRAHRQVSALNSIVLTLYLWHVSALAVAAAFVYPLGFPQAETGTAAWWAGRPLWLVVIAPFLALFVFTFHRFEVHPAPRLEPHTTHRWVRHAAAAIAVVSLAMGILGFGVTGFDHVAESGRETVLAFSANPLQNVLHVAVGLGVLWSVYVPRWVVPAAAGTSVLYAVIGLAGSSSGIGLVAMNPATAVLHVAVGSLGLCLVGAAAAADRRRRSPHPTSTGATERRCSLP